ncbi:hypothetical protein N9934_01730 [Desulfosarcina sp.]|nr:hypothetical protein [Desulfosarcina sp.]
MAPYIAFAGAFVLPAIFLLRGSPWTRYALTAIAVMSLGGWVYMFSPFADYYYILILPNAVCAYLLIFSRSFREELDRRSGRNLVWKHFTKFAIAIVAFAVIFGGMDAYMTRQSKNEFSSEFALLEQCYAVEINLMRKIRTDMRDKLQSFNNNEFKSKWIESYASAAHSMRFRGLYILLSASPHENIDSSINLSHDFFPEYHAGGGIPLLSNEDRTIFIGRRMPEPTIYSLLFHESFPFGLLRVNAYFDTPDLEKCGRAIKGGSSD